MKFYSVTEPVRYEGPEAKSALAYRWYNPKQKVLGKTMAQHLRFAVCYWHSLGWPGPDPFGRRPWPAEERRQARQRPPYSEFA